VTVTIHTGDCREVLSRMEPASVDAVVCDPPYGLAFMGKRWDYDVPSVETWQAVLRVLKPGGHLLAFAGTRTQHRMCVNIEDAGFEIRDMIAWVYGQGFPKSLDVSKAIDKAAGAERERIRGVRSGVVANTYARDAWSEEYKDSVLDSTPLTDAAKQWQGWGTALKPALEPITVARKPLVGTVAENVLMHGTGAINVDGCRVETDDDRSRPPGGGSTENWRLTNRTEASDSHPAGRWPANLIHDGSEEVVGLFPVTGASKAAARGGTNPNPMDWGNGRADGNVVKGHDDNGGSAARFFYCAKASKRDRDEGCDDAALVRGGVEQFDSRWKDGTGDDRKPLCRNHHPTVKPTDLMRYLCRLVTPPGGIVLDPFMGSGSTGKAAVMEGFRFVGIELNPEYADMARARIAAVQPTLIGGIA
jgi:DNA modification methylase